MSQYERLPKLAQHLHLQASGVENLVIIGSGPAGYTAAIYAARANLKPVVFEGYQVGGVRGGQLMTTTEVENFPGFPEGVTGPDLMDKMRAQAERWGSELLTEDVEQVDLGNRPFTVRTSDTEVKAHSIIIATGATAKRLGIPSEDKFWSQGISACAICDGASYSFRNQELAVVGGGDTAVEEAIYLTKYGSMVHLLARGEKLRASRSMQDRALDHKKVTVHFNTIVDDAYPDGKGALAGLHIKDTKTGQPLEHNTLRLTAQAAQRANGMCLLKWQLQEMTRFQAHQQVVVQILSQSSWTDQCKCHVLCDSKHGVLGAGEGSKLLVKGLFYGIGHQPNSQLVAGQIDLDEHGYVKVSRAEAVQPTQQQHHIKSDIPSRQKCAVVEGEQSSGVQVHDGVQTSVEGVYAAGDLFDVEWRQAITAAGSGCMAALSAERYLTANDLAQEYHTKEQDDAKSLQPEEKQTADAEAEFDINQDRHKGQLALRKLYHESDRVIVVLYTSPTCGPCRTLKPIFSKVVDEYEKQVHLVEIDIEQDPQIAEAAGVQSTPTVQMFKDKERIQHLPGVKMKSDYRKLISQALEEKASVPA
ncbi:TPA: hypothetical protein ACH3X1_015592 [Trebouxia sp. C0004]